MNQGRIWTVVKPSVGLPLLLGSVTVIAVGVHFAVLTHTTWFGAYWEGGKVKRASLEESVSPVALNKAMPSFTVNDRVAILAEK
jgi:light-harvesting protein B-800-850 alpha chain